MPFVLEDLGEKAAAWVLESFLENSQNTFLSFCLHYKLQQWSSGRKAGIIMMIIVLNKVAACSLLFVIILVKYLALASVRSFQYWESWDFHMMWCVCSQNAHNCSSCQNYFALQVAKSCYVIRRQKKHESVFDFFTWSSSGSSSLTSLCVLFTAFNAFYSIFQNRCKKLSINSCDHVTLTEVAGYYGLELL